MKKFMAIFLMLWIVASPLSAHKADQNPPQTGGQMQANGKTILPNTVIGKGTKITFIIKPDPEFKQFLPQDARYGVKEVAFFTQLSLSPAVQIGKVNVEGRNAVEGLEIPVPSECFARSGAKVYMEIKDLYRMNFKGEKIVDERVTPYEKVFTFIAK